ncbi:recombinase family protein [Nocardioides sp. HDW12B]|uniref:recombinase family protein n=1 Tax=Nocardioides sp. HDW12B TaxID=2714939 RepID=UPI00140A11B3|nr:recombinase family protein [Nocardioides sp. HDW12B]QIK65612.1 recombinase family protein [Nocardioides sp. HDW12B]
MTRHIAVYVRISQDRDLNRDKVTRQHTECEKLLKKLQGDGILRKGLRVEVYEDNDTSAYDTKKREAFERLMDDAAKGYVEAIIADNTDRLYRRVLDLYRVAGLIRDQRHLTVHTSKAGRVDFSTPAGRLAAVMLAAVAEYEVELKSVRQKSQSDQLARTGAPRRGGRRPFGYEKNGLDIIAPEAQQVREAADLLLGGASVMSVLREWNRSGLPPVRGGVWQHSSFCAVMTRPRNAAIREHRGKLVGDALWPPILDESTFEQVRDLLTDPSRSTTTDRTRKHLLSFVLKCGRCGGAMRAGATRSRGRTYPVLQCHGLDGCRLAISYGVAETAVRSYIQRRLTLPDATLKQATRDGRKDLADLRRERAVLASDELEVQARDISLKMKLLFLADLHARRRQIDGEVQSLERRLSLAGLVVEPTIRGGVTASRASPSREPPRCDALTLWTYKRAGEWSGLCAR